ncbi:hypothetical protein BHE74_00037881 [Ensete ventricosum]|uniref:Uncharacterized protein n=1 Tax=Ensete ventricosum TaxID=4639 RepID=A0A444G0V5_ENSVE|nr:hypothetical protein B296_00023589 [Ensete ventricosum]RWW28536.1 hypothetical protein GW17_00006984 [Ensete ventricosum]RWW55481.1 hypothetical protein BHE74_00037881 [Ensete ventricosum]RZS14563.1 hypothetical protein BHM03_00046254 [Ensete ventricosum]
MRITCLLIPIRIQGSPPIVARHRRGLCGWTDRALGRLSRSQRRRFSIAGFFDLNSHLSASASRNLLLDRSSRGRSGFHSPIHITRNPLNFLIVVDKLVICFGAGQFFVLSHSSVQVIS